MLTCLSLVIHADPSITTIVSLFVGQQITQTEFVLCSVRVMGPWASCANHWDLTPGLSRRLMHSGFHLALTHVACKLTIRCKSAKLVLAEKLPKQVSTDADFQ